VSSQPYGIYDRNNGPANHVIGAGGFLIDQELHLHIDPAVIALEAIDLRYVAQVCAIHDGRCSPFFHSAAALFTAFASAAPIFPPEVMMSSYTLIDPMCDDIIVADPKPPIVRFVP
ncbi:MAG: hypothetical protein WA703_21915, partial [Pseudolabrys sp.]